MANQPQLPDWDIIVTCLKEITTEFRFFQNLAPVEQATARAALQKHVDVLTKNLQSLSAFVKGLNHTVQGNKTASDNSIQAAKDELTHAFQEEMQSMKAFFQRVVDDCEFNNGARISNSRVTKRENKLRPLRNTTTHQVVMLPETLKKLENLELEELDDILLELGQEPEYGDPERGDIELERTERVDQLKRFIGIEV
ncbi:hypothetical protein EV127DRAFT_479324 [Xylaria flabelliformis]|nr:hypothetical protein EV127DRAFT_479324 [Xylaria flabelliformis]